MEITLSVLGELLLTTACVLMLLAKSFSLGCWFLLFQKCYCVPTCNELLRKETAMVAKETNCLPADLLLNNPEQLYPCQVP